MGRKVDDFFLRLSQNLVPTPHQRAIGCVLLYLDL